MAITSVELVDCAEKKTQFSPDFERPFLHGDFMMFISEIFNFAVDQNKCVHLNFVLMETLHPEPSPKNIENLTR